MLTEFERYNTERDDLCPFLRWKGQFVMSDNDPTLRSRSFWCLYTQTCLGPDGGVAEPVECASPERRCYGTGKA
jgi:hypothetical protein